MSAMCNTWVILTWFIFPTMSKGSVPDIIDVIAQRGYPLESHIIETYDGYLLTYHRIPYGKSPQHNHQVTDGPDTAPEHRKPGTPVLLQHGLLCSSAAWVLSEHGLGYALADAGFDVWMGNARGNTYSRRHKTLDPDKDVEFWKFSFHEMGTRDLPAAIDHILAKTGYDQLMYVGHSMGTTMFYTMGAAPSRYMAKVKAMVALAPVVFPWHVKSPIIRLSQYLTNTLVFSAKVLRLHEIFPYSRMVSWANKYICSKKYYKFICRMAFRLMDGFNGKCINRTPLQTILSYIPGGSSLRTLRHFSQLVEKGKPFRMYDYRTKNQYKYGTETPPTYDLSKVTVPMYVFYGRNDWVATPRDVRFSVHAFPNVKKITRVPHDRFSHLDFMWATDRNLLIDDVISTLNKISIEENNFNYE